MDSKEELKSMTEEVKRAGKGTYVKYEALRKEIDDMLSILPGDWLVEEIRLDRAGPGLDRDGPGWCGIIARDKNVVVAAGRGRTKAEALENILEGWRKGVLEPYAPAAGSAEELRLKMAVRKG